MISLLCPTRNRPGNVRRMCHSALGTAGDIEFVFYVDDDAPGSVPSDVAGKPNVTVIVGPRIVLSDMWNACWREAQGDILMQCDDETLFRPAGWDDMVRQAFDACPDRIVLVHGNNLIQGAAMGTHPFLHRRWTEVLGYFTPPHFSCDFGDTWLNDLADRIGRRVYLPDVITEHLHPGCGKAEWDQTHYDRIERRFRDNVDAIWTATEAERAADAEKLRAAMTCG